MSTCPSRSEDLPRRRFLCSAMAAAALYSFDMPRARARSEGVLIENITRLYAVRVDREIAPTSVAEVKAAVRGWLGQISVGGGRYSMGGQVALPGSLHLDMRGLNRLVWIRPDERRVRVQAGMRWRELQDILDPLELSVHTMQSFANFTVGGSVSVNVHGRYVRHGAIAASVLALQLVMADGAVVEASRSRNAPLFAAAIGGYGAVGVITEVELMLDRNARIERSVELVPLDDYPAHFAKTVLADPEAVLHNADLLPPLFREAVSITWRHSNKPLTVPDRLVPRNRRYALERSMLWAITELPAGERLRERLVRDRLLDRPAVIWRNYEASLDVAMLEPTSRSVSTYALQEYFVPVRNFAAFAAGMAEIIKRHNAQVLNVSVRHALADSDALMHWAREDVFAFVLYYKQRTHARARAQVGLWTRQLIDLALVLEGTYYLPYQLHASQEQFERAYPQVEQLRALKREIDPAMRFSNELWREYL